MLKGETRAIADGVANHVRTMNELVENAGQYERSRKWRHYP